MKKFVFSSLVSVASLVVAAEAHAQSAAIAAPSTLGPAVAVDGPRFRFGVELGGGLAIATTFARYNNVADRTLALNLRLGVQLNDTWAIMAQTGVGATAGVVMVPSSLLAEVSPNRFVGFAFGPSVSLLQVQGLSLAGAGATLRLMGYLGSTAPRRRHSFVYGIESNASFIEGGMFSTVTVALGYEMH